MELEERRRRSMGYTSRRAMPRTGPTRPNRIPSPSPNPIRSSPIPSSSRAIPIRTSPNHHANPNHHAPHTSSSRARQGW